MDFEETTKANIRKAVSKRIILPDDLFPDGLDFFTGVAIDRDLLQDIRDLFDNEAGNKYSAHLRDKLDSLYPYLNQK